MQIHENPDRRKFLRGDDTYNKIEVWRCCPFWNVIRKKCEHPIETNLAGECVYSYTNLADITDPEELTKRFERLFREISSAQVSKFHPVIESL